MPPPPLPEAFAEPSQDWGTDQDPWNTASDNNQQQATNTQAVMILCIYKLQNCMDL